MILLVPPESGVCNNPPAPSIILPKSMKQNVSHFDIKMAIMAAISELPGVIVVVEDEYIKSKPTVDAGRFHFKTSFLNGGISHKFGISPHGPLWVDPSSGIPPLNPNHTGGYPIGWGY